VNVVPEEVKNAVRNICVICGRSTRKMRCPRCGVRTIQRLQRNWFLSIGTRRNDREREPDPKVSIDEYEKFRVTAGGCRG